MTKTFDFAAGLEVGYMLSLETHVGGLLPVRTRRPLRSLALAVLFLFFFLLRVGRAQDAELSGNVRDASGGAIPNATVRIVSKDTGLARTSPVTEAGLYGFPGLKAGMYDVDVRSEGFKKLVQMDLKLEVSQRARLDFALEVGDVQQSVTVNACTEILQTRDSSLGQVVQGRQVLDMPLNGRDVMNLVALVPGVVPQGSTQGSAVANKIGGTGTNNGGWNNYQIGGGFAGYSATYIDGAPDNVQFSKNYTVLVPTQDAIQEFRVETNNVSAEFGGFGGGVINMSTKSGGNTFHGTAYEYLRNKLLNANDFFNNRSGLPRPAFTQNQYGADIGGPVIKDKTFFSSVGRSLDSVKVLPLYSGCRLRCHCPFSESASRKLSATATIT